jgi:hypothetical protein
MRIPASRLLILAPVLLTACASIGPPQPPTLDLPKPPADLKAVRKGESVILAWTIPTATTDRQTIRSLGPTRICRGAADLKDCGTPVGQTTTNIPPHTSAESKSGSKKEKSPASYTDTLPLSALSNSTSASISYAVEVLNPDERGAGLSNRVQVPLVQTLPPPADLQAKVTSQGVVLTWTNHLPPPNPERSLRYVYRVYRRQEGSQQAELVGELPGSN